MSDDKKQVGGPARPDAVRLYQVHLPFRVLYGTSGMGSNLVTDSGDNKVRIELLGWHTVRITPAHGRAAIVSWAGCYAQEWIDCHEKGCVLISGHEANSAHVDGRGNAIRVGKVGEAA